MYAVIEPVTYRTGQGTRLLIRSVNIQLDVGASIQWSVHSEDKKEFESGGLMMSGVDYTAWASDDTYVLQWVASQLNLTIDSIEPGDFWMTPSI